VITIRIAGETLTPESGPGFRPCLSQLKPRPLDAISLASTERTFQPWASTSAH
jgi:hypothetical protein